MDEKIQEAIKDIKVKHNGLVAWNDTRLRFDFKYKCVSIIVHTDGNMIYMKNGKEVDFLIEDELYKKIDLVRSAWLERKI